MTNKHACVEPMVYPQNNHVLSTIQLGWLQVSYPTTLNIAPMGTTRIRANINSSMGIPPIQTINIRRRKTLSQSTHPYKLYMLLKYKVFNVRSVVEEREGSYHSHVRAC